MNITVLNGSPKGEISVTMQYVGYLRKKFPQHTFEIVHVAQRIKHLEKDRAAFDAVIAQVRRSDGVLWAFPLYILVVHAHYKRFIELIFERGAGDAFAGKYAASLSTSIHFFDHTAHNYVEAVCDDLGMSYVGRYAAAMQDLMQPEACEQLVKFGQLFWEAIEQRQAMPRRYASLVPSDFTYAPGPAAAPIPLVERRVLILHYARDPESSLARMVERLRASFSGDVSAVNLYDLDIKASCQGCLHCGANYACSFEGKDGYIDFFRANVVPADVLIVAGTMTDRYLSARWKMFFDRWFFNTHTTVLMGKQAVFVISGPLGQNGNLREVLQAFFELQRANVLDFVTDESGTSADLDAALDGLAVRLIRAAELGYTAPQTFLGVAGMKLFRDEVYGRLRATFPADFRAYRRLGIFDFPQRQWRVRLFNATAGRVLNVPRVRRWFTRQIKPGMIMGLKSVVEQA